MRQNFFVFKFVWRSRRQVEMALIETTLRQFESSISILRCNTLVLTACCGRSSNVPIVEK